MEKVTIYGINVSGGDGSAYPYWYLSKKKIDELFVKSCGGLGEHCVFEVETFVGSKIYQEAVRNDAQTEPFAEDAFY